jgi:hypothetical protein
MSWRKTELGGYALTANCIRYGALAIYIRPRGLFACLFLSCSTYEGHEDTPKLRGGGRKIKKKIRMNTNNRSSNLNGSKA